MNTEELIQSLAQQGAKPASKPPHRMLMRWAISLTLIYIAMVALFGIRDDITQKANELWFWWEIIAISATGCLAAWAANWLALPDSNNLYQYRWLPIIALSIVLASLIYSTLSVGQLSLSECLKLGRFDCLGRIMAGSVVPGVILLLSQRRAAPIHHHWAGTMTGLAVASFAYLAMRCIDTADEPLALLIWFFIPVLLVSAIGGILGRPLFHNSV